MGGGGLALARGNQFLPGPRDVSSEVVAHHLDHVEDVAVIGRADTSWEL
jgi:hypothetical protein